MVKFNSRNISANQATVAEQLKAKREERGLSYKKLGRKTNINPRYLKALEEEDYEKLPRGIYQNKILRKYTSYLGLNTEEIEKLFLKEKNALHPSKKKNLFSIKRVKWGNFLIFPKILRNTLAVIVVLFFFAYLGSYLNGVFSPPELKILSPEKDSLITEEKNINILGKTQPETEVFINNRAILSCNDGFFEKEINLKQGVNIITIKAQKKYGQKKVVKKQVLAKEN